ncbi:hypothetical protein Cgig2_021882 [Carnegiea gigantea]|uniref:Uncharacterized protein n=1 Tax=Carnegiea gigantea TaxID=171969 RepID=A0A9Q1JJ64_9CARY|nr:hypothetical protein Cgig2_021882 [Carnegiea gigantea]
MDLNTETLASLPIWGLESLSKLGSMLGIPIKTDKYTRDKSFLKYARLLIEIQLEDNFLEYIEFVNEHNVVVRQRVEYEWKPTKCDFCKMHEPQELAPPNLHVDEEGFITIRKRAQQQLLEARTYQQQQLLHPHLFRNYLRCNTVSHHEGLLYNICLWGQSRFAKERFMRGFEKYSNSMDDAWCILADFNAILYAGDKIGGTEVQFHEVQSFGDCITACELQELRSIGPYYTWTEQNHLD